MLLAGVSIVLVPWYLGIMVSCCCCLLLLWCCLWNCSIVLHKRDLVKATDCEDGKLWKGPSRGFSCSKKRLEVLLPRDKFYTMNYGFVFKTQIKRKFASLVYILYLNLYAGERASV